MARQALGPRKLARYSNQFGIPFEYGLVRGGTDHRVDLRSSNGEWFHYYPNETREYGQLDNAAGECVATVRRQ